MKKVLTLLTLLMAFAINGFAQDVEKLYIMGQGTPGEWTATTEMAYNETTQAFEYTLDSSAKIYFTIGDAAFENWDDFNGNHRWAIAAGDQNATVGTETQLVKANNGTIVLNAGKYLVSITKEMKMTITLVEEATPPTIESMWVVGELTGGWPNGEDWSMAKAMTQDTENAAIWTLTIEGFEAEAKAYKYKATANGKWGDYELPAEGDQTYTFEEAGKFNLTFTANTKENTLTLAVEKVEEQPALNTYTATFTTNAKWEKAYAYAWSGEGEGVVKFLGDWPGTALEATDGVYTVTISAAAAPEKIIFNNGKSENFVKQQTEDLDFEDGKAYTFTVPSPAFENGSYYIQNIANGLFLAADQDFAGAEGTLFGFTFDESLGAYSITGNDFFAWDNKKWYVVGDATSFKTYYILNNKKYYLALSERNGWVVYDEGNELMTDDNSTWCVKPKTTEPEPVVITSMAIVGDLTGGWPVKDEVSGEEDWSMAKAMTQDAENPAVWTLTIEGFEAEAKKYEYKATANGKWGEYELPAEGNQTYTFEEAGKYNLTFTANTKEHTLTLAVEKATEPEPVPNTYTVKFDNKGGWEHVYAYAFTAGGNGQVTEFLGSWPGTEQTITEEGSGLYIVEIKAAEAPAFIIFNNGAGTQTEDLAFEDGKTYVYEIPVEPVNHTWDFTQWSDETVDNLKADAATSKLEGWSDVEKKTDAEADAAPTDISKDNCFWYVGGEATPTANGVAIKELKGLEFNTTYGAARSLAIAVNYPETSLGSYKGGAYLWLGGKGKECFTIKNVKVGSTLTIGAESHKPAEGRGIQLKINGENFGDAFTPTTFAENSWTITSTDESVKVVDVVVTNTNGCHLYYIDVDIVEVPVADGYYLAGSMNNWVPTEADALQENTEAAGEYMKTLDMTAQTEIKVVKVENFAIAAWYPAEGANYVISEDANYTVYFRPDGNTEWENGFFFVQKNDATGIAVLKALQENGAVVYNLSGQRISVAKKGLYIVNGRKVVVK